MNIIKYIWCKKTKKKSERREDKRAAELELKPDGSFSCGCGMMAHPEGKTVRISSEKIGGFIGKTPDYMKQYEHLIIEPSCTFIRSGGFSKWTSLKSVTVPGTAKEIRSYAFRGCTSLTEVNLQHGVNFFATGTFDGCTALTTISLPDSMTYVVKGMFYACTGLTQITIPDSVTRIEECAFEGCTALTTLTIPDTVVEIGENAFKDVPHIIYHGPAKSDDNWGAKSMN